MLDDAHHPGALVDDLFQPTLVAADSIDLDLPDPGAAVEQLDRQIRRLAVDPGVDPPGTRVEEVLGANAGRVVVHHRGEDDVAASRDPGFGDRRGASAEGGNAALHVLDPAAVDHALLDPRVRWIALPLSNRRRVVEMTVQHAALV